MLRRRTWARAGSEPDRKCGRLCNCVNLLVFAMEEEKDGAEVILSLEDEEVIGDDGTDKLDLASELLTILDKEDTDVGDLVLSEELNISVCCCPAELALFSFGRSPSLSTHVCVLINAME